MSDRKERTIPAEVKKSLFRRKEWLVETSIRGSVPTEYEEDLAELIEQIERDGPTFLWATLGDTEPPFPEITVGLDSERLSASIRLGIVADSDLTQLFFCAKSKIYLQEEKRVLVTIRRQVPEQHASQFKKYIEALADLASSHIEVTGHLPVVSVGTTARPRNYYRGSVLDIVHAELQQGSPPEKILKALEKAYDITQGDPLFQKWKKEKGISSWLDVKKDPDLRQRWQIWISKCKKAMRS